MTPERDQRIRTIAAGRQADLTVLMERVHKPHNLAAILRTCDAVGVMQAHAVPAEQGIPALNHTAQGAQRWVPVVRHPDTPTAMHALRDAGMTCLAAHFSDRAVDFREPDYTGPTAIVLGTEKFGVTDEALALCHGEIRIPMHGMTRSLNVSVACALILYEAERQRRAAGLYAPADLDAEPHRSLVEGWIARELARRRMPPADD